MRTQMAIQVQDLICDFGAVRALNGLSLQVPKGSVFGFLGPNGAGKTTTIRLLLGLLEPTAGRAQVLGFDPRHQAHEIRKRTGALLEHTGIYEHLSAEDNLTFYGRVWRLPAAQMRARIRELLVPMGLWDRRKDLAGTWSRGMKQKLALARTLLHRPQLILLDEPTAGLDAAAAAAIRHQLQALAVREQVTILMATHNLPEAETLCHQVAVVRAGRVIAVGRPDQLRTQASTPRVQVVGHGFTEQALELLRARPEVTAARRQNHHLDIDLRLETDIAPLVQLLVSAGVQVEEVHRVRASLEEVFLALTQGGNHD